MTGTSFTERLGLATTVLEYYRLDREALDAKGIRADFWIAAIERAIEGLTAEEARQESLKVDLRETTDRVRQMDRETYALVAGAIDAAVGAHGKGTPEADVVARLRSQLHRRRKAKPETSDSPEHEGPA